MNTTDTDGRRLQQARRRADTNGLIVRTLRENSRDYQQYGPHTLVDARSNSVLASGLDLHQLEDEIRARADDQQAAG